MLSELGMDDVTDVDCHYVQLICQAVSSRAAYLASAGDETRVLSRCFRFVFFNCKHRFARHCVVVMCRHRSAREARQPE